jgi:hypothetical protein
MLRRANGTPSVMSSGAIADMPPERPACQSCHDMDEQSRLAGKQQNPGEDQADAIGFGNWAHRSDALIIRMYNPCLSVDWQRADRSCLTAALDRIAMSEFSWEPYFALCFASASTVMNRCRAQPFHNHLSISDDGIALLG